MLERGMQEEGDAAAALCTVPRQLLHSAQASSGPRLPSWEQLNQQREADSEVTAKLLSGPHTSSFLLGFNLGLGVLENSVL
ncbi:hypothetical protein A6R68_02153 [Neotoma lepida]|uniref:Uncharacterized protein n=1 Tax=Neotoma lepida TaxID=56216 RepID=A0A1A6GUL2_NEOLE|nr:hypothetical protein A6R68_02153 [Neotoma lepida]